MRGHLREVVRLGWGGAKSNLLPGAVLWVIGLALVISYYQIRPVAEVLDQLGDFKLKSSPWFAILSTALFGSLIPWLVPKFVLERRRETTFSSCSMAPSFLGFSRMAGRTGFIGFKRGYLVTKLISRRF
jgi:hypothetical protein